MVLSLALKWSVMRKMVVLSKSIKGDNAVEIDNPVVESCTLCTKDQHWEQLHSTNRDSLFLIDLPLVSPLVLCFVLSTNNFITNLTQVGGVPSTSSTLCT